MSPSARCNYFHEFVLAGGSEKIRKNGAHQSARILSVSAVDRSSKDLSPSLSSSVSVLPDCNKQPRHMVAIAFAAPAPVVERISPDFAQFL